MTKHSDHYDVAIIGAGIVGLSTAHALSLLEPNISLIVLEAEPRVATQQTGHNSGVIHSGIHYPPGSLKATLCTSGREMLTAFCEQRGIEFRRCGKLIVATTESEVHSLIGLQHRGSANGLRGLSQLNARELSAHEPHVRGLAGLLVPETGIVDFAAVAQGLADEIREAGHTIRLNTRLTRAQVRGGTLSLDTTDGRVTCHRLINCAGLYSDRVARMCGLQPKVKIIPFRGEYLELIPQRRCLVRGLIYPVPDPRVPFLGPHFTPTLSGHVLAGPNAVLALKREGYHRMDVSLADTMDMASFPGFWRMGARLWRTGIAELRRSASRAAMIRSLRRLIPELAPGDLGRSSSGVRAQAVANTGELIDDFLIMETDRAIHVLNAPSPAATSALAIGNHIAQRAKQTILLEW